MCYNREKLKDQGGGKMEIGTIINKRRNELDLTLEDVGNAVGVSKSTVKKWEDGYISNMKRDKIAELAKVLQISPVVLITGDCPNEGTDINKLGGQAYNSENMVPVPVVGRVAAGLSCFAETDIESYELVSSESILPGYEYMWLRVTGDSMEPIICENDLVLVRLQDIVDDGDYAVVLVDNEDGLVKKMHLEKDSLSLISINPYYPPRIFKEKDMKRIRIIGKVIESKRKF